MSFIASSNGSSLASTSTGLIRRILIPACSLVIIALLPIIIHGLITDESGIYLLALLAVIQLSICIFSFAAKSYNYISFIFPVHFMGYTVGKWKSLKDLGLSSFRPESKLEIKEMIICTLISILVYLFLRYLVFRKYTSEKPGVFANMTKSQVLFSLLLGWIGPWFVTNYADKFSYILHLLNIVNIAYVFSAEGPTPRWNKFARFGLIGALIFSFFNSTALSLILVGLFAMIITSSASGFKAGDVVSIVGIAIVLLLLQPIKGVFRELGSGSSVSERLIIAKDLMLMAYFPSFSGVTEEDRSKFFSKASIVSDVVTQALMQDAEETGADPDLTKGADSTDLVLSGYDRASDESLERVLLMTPNEVPFWGGETYGNLFYMFIPRLLWPDKPTYGSIWHKFGQAYGYLNANDLFTSVAFSYLAEGYMNFGYTGLYSSALLFGCLVALMELMAAIIMGKPNRFTFCLFMLPIFSYQSDFSSMLTTSFYYIALVFLLRPILIRLSHSGYSL